MNREIGEPLGVLKLPSRSYLLDSRFGLDREPEDVQLYQTKSLSEIGEESR